MSSLTKTQRLSGQTNRRNRRSGSRGQAPDIYGVIRDRICLLKYPPGTVLAETVLAEEFGVSRTPVRQALQRLDYEGLVETRNGVGTSVTGVDFREFREIDALRLRLNELIGDFSSTANLESAAEKIDSLILRTEELLKSREFEEFWKIHHELHFEVSSLISNAAFREVHDRLYYQASRVWYSVLEVIWDEEVEYLLKQLRELRRALRSGDLRAVGLIQRNYIAYGLVRLGQYLSL
jgi:DNA-binding GntR family transcriptional regulator